MDDPHPNGSQVSEGEPQSEFDRFEDLTKQLLTVPKSELDKQLNGAKLKPRRRSRTAS